MPNLLRDFLLSFCPSGVRRIWRPASSLTVLRAATWGGITQFLLASVVIVVRLKGYFIARSHQLATHIAGSNETGQTVMAVVVILEFMLYPFSLFLLYLATEGLFRFIGGLTIGEIVPNLLVSSFFRASDSFARSRARRRDGPSVADSMERLPDDRIRITSACAKPGWNASITIGIGGQWFEVEREERANGPRAFVYILRPAPPGKILRGYEEYAAASISNGSVHEGGAGPGIS